jgi:ADP-ribosylglycohydrolase
MFLNQRQKDILLAGAIGDAVGYIVEFENLGKIIRKYGPNGLTLDMIHPQATLTVSDDTQMTLFSLEAVHLFCRLKGDYYFDMFMEDQYYKIFMQWFYTQTDKYSPLITSHVAKFPAMQHQRAPGNTCLGALNKSLPRPVPINDSKGCGGIMRAAPFGFLENAEDAFNHGCIQARVTHGHPSGHLPAGFFAGLIHTLTNCEGSTLISAVDTNLIFLNNCADNTETVDIIEKSLRIATESGGDVFSDLRRIGEGWVGEEALGVALYSVAIAESFEEVIKISINHNGDSDSTGSLAAQLWVAIHGLPEKYRKWEDRLDVANAFSYVTNGDNYK